MLADGSPACAERVPPGATVVDADPKMSGAWSGAVHVTRSITFPSNARELTIEPGTQVFVDPDVLLEFGLAGTENLLEVSGTASAPIRFCRSSKAGRNWQGIAIGKSVLSSSALQHVVIEGAGASKQALFLDTGVLVDHVWVRDSANDGVRASDFRDDSSSLWVTGSKGAPLVLTAPQAVQRLPQGGRFDGNDEDIARVSFDYLSVPTQFREIGVPYQLDVGLKQGDMAHLKIDAGVELRVGIDKALELGWVGGKAEVQIDGTASKPVLIRGVDARPGSWLGLSIGDSVFSTSTLKQLTIMHAGGKNGSALAIKSPITATDIALEDNAHEAFYIGEQGLAPESARFTVTGTKGAAGRVGAAALMTLPTEGSYVGNELDYIAVDSGNLSRTGTIPEVDVPFRVLGDLHVTNNATLTIAAGVEFQMQDATSFQVGWVGTKATLIAVGTADKPIKFHGTTSQPGLWGAIYVDDSVTPSSRIEYVEVRDGGGDSKLKANLLLRSPITVANCTLAGSAGYGLIARKAHTQDYESMNTFENNASGAVLRD